MSIDEAYYLICSHLIVADGEINIKELETLSNRFDRLKVTEKLEEEQKKIFQDRDDKISDSTLFAVLQNANTGTLDDFFRTLFSIAYADDYYDDREKAYIEHIRKQLNFDETKVTLIEKEIASLHVYKPKEEHWAELLKAVFERIIYELKEEKDREYEYELLSGANFSRKITAIAKNSEEDLAISDSIMQKLSNELEKEVKSIGTIVDILKDKDRKDGSLTASIQIVESLYRTINATIIKSLKNNLEVLNKKKRTANYFTIAFMGRTKAGKSTFHKVVTHEETDDIGIGKLRTTRYNRCWYWQHLRIIDTPGIGAPGGETDEKVAHSIIDEADLICYLVTNDSIQQTEFDFLSGLKEKNKPLFIILNVKQNLDGVRLKRFFREPTAWLHDTGPQNIQGHIDRIQECIGGKYDLSAIQIVPLQLLAAIKYFDKNSEWTEEEKNALLEGSNIKQFVKLIKECVFRSGNIKKSLNIVDGCYVQTDDIYQVLHKYCDDLKKQRDQLSNKKNMLISFIENESIRTRNAIISAIRECHNRLRNNVTSFSDEYYEEKDNKVLQRKWTEYYPNKTAYQHLQDNIEKEVNGFQKAVKDKVEECFDDLQFYFSQKELNDNLRGDEIFNSRRAAQIGTGIGIAIIGIASLKLGALAFAATNFWNPAGWATFITLAAAAVGTWIVSWFKSKATKIQEAKDKMAKALRSSITANETKMIEDILPKFDNSINEIKISLEKNFSTILDNLKKLIILNDDLSNDCQTFKNEYNIVVAYRIIQQLRPRITQTIAEYGISNLSKDFSVVRPSRFSLEISCPYQMDKDDEKIASELTQMTITLK